MFKLAIIGRPNVGKSTLFNRLVGKRMAIVSDTPGVTRDWRTAPGKLYDYFFDIIDTAGLEDTSDDSIEGRMRAQTESAIEKADLLLFVIDGRDGVTPIDEHFASLIRAQKKPAILLVNKAENQSAVASAVGESYALGLGDPIEVSAEHGTGFEDLYEALKPYEKFLSEDAPEEKISTDDLDNLDAIEGDENFEFIDDEPELDEKPLKIAIVGRPNVGKSTLLNAIVQDQRVMTGPEAGITRDAIAVNWDYKGKRYQLVDTAGIRRKAKIQDTIERFSVDDSMRAIRLAQVCILVLDSSMALEKQDLQIAARIIEEGRALVIAMNKWDNIRDKNKTLEHFQYKLETSLSQIKQIQFVTLSALHGKNIPKLLETISQTYEIWNRRVSTGKLNRWLAGVESKNPAPLVAGRQNRLKYIAQIKTRPPTFALWASRPEKLPDSYKRYIINALRESYGLPGVPIRLLLRKSKNPYVN